MSKSSIDLAKEKIMRMAQRLRLAEACLVFAFAFAGMWVVAQVAVNWAGLSTVWIAATALVTAFIAAVFTWRRSLHTPLSFALQLNRHHAELQESAHLLLQPESLGLAGSIQAAHAAEFIRNSTEPTSNLRRNLSSLATIAAAWVLLCAALAWALQEAHRRPTQSMQKIAGNNQNKITLPAKIEQVVVTITPPAYTRLATQTESSFNITVPQGARITWQVKAAGAIQGVSLKLPQTTTPLVQNSNVWQAEWVAERTAVYSLLLQDEARTHESEPYAITVIPDQAPTIDLQQPASVTELRYDAASLPIAAVVRDDYGMTSAALMLTIARGKGEGVRFEEKALALTGGTIGTTHWSITYALALTNLKLAPGDEVYGCLVATDNRQPLPQTHRSETFFAQVEDTTAPTSELTMSLGVDRMPQYFRSQRQIIIDTEKIIAQKASLDKKEFVLRSNDIGIDQKVLRLRYGQFLGEEFESGTGPGISDDAHYAGDGHDHDGDHAGAEQHKASDGHDHSGGVQSGALRGNAATNNPILDMASQFGHVHDVEEQATFLPEAVKVQLKACLAQMWEAELRLRIGKPEEALPYEEKALKLLKEVQQKSRMYIRKVGFEAPPLKPDEKRLSGELAGIKPDVVAQTADTREAYVAARAAYALLAQKRNGPLKPQDVAVLQAAGAELAQAASEQPAQYLASLGDLRKLIAAAQQNQAACGPCALRVCGALLTLLREAPAAPQAAGGHNRLAKLYHDKLQGR